MAFRPNASELDAVVAILETDHDDPRSMARSIVSTLAGLLARRQTYAVVPAGHPFGYGPYWSQLDAAKAWDTAIGATVGVRGHVVPVYPWAPPEIHTAGACECGHPPEIHVVRGPKNKPSKPAECGRRACECPSFTPRKVNP